MQIRVVDECNEYQIVKFEKNYYMLHKLELGLNCAPAIMKVELCPKFYHWIKVFSKQPITTMMISSSNLHCQCREGKKNNCLSLDSQPSQLRSCALQKCLVYRRMKKDLLTGGELS